MAVNLKDLPPEYQVQALRKLAEQQAPREPDAGSGRKSKFHNIPAERTVCKPGGTVIRFDSQKEAHRYDELFVMLQAGTIRDLKLQPQFTLQEAYTTTEGVRIRAIRYQADFSYWERDRFVVEDVKSRPTRTREYRMKKKLMQERLGISVEEV